MTHHLCPSCGYQRADTDTGPTTECPKCRMPYAWGRRPAPAQRQRHTATHDEATAPTTEAVIAGAVLALGCFAPLVRLPIVGGVNAVHAQHGVGYILLGLAVLAILFAARRWMLGMKIASGIGFVLVIATAASMYAHLAEAKAQMTANLQGNPFAGLAQLAAQSIQPEWGWIPLLAGSIGLLAVSMGYRMPQR